MSYSPPSFRFVVHGNGSLTLTGTGTGVIGDSRYYVNDAPLADAFSRYVPRALADLLDVAVAVYLADRLGRRTGARDRYEHHWQRAMQVRIPVRDPERWNAPAVIEALRATLIHLTEDDWNFEFTPRSLGRGRVSEDVQYLFPEKLEAPVLVSLFSGGLDSLAGLVDDLETRPSGSVILVSANTTARILPVQRALVNALRLRSKRQIIWTVGQFGLRHRDAKQYEREERSQRTRGFAFTALGAIAAIMAESETLRLYENGVGAINLPYTEWQLGAQSTRAMHPTFIGLMERLVGLVTERDNGGRAPRLELASLYRTKGDLCRSLGQSDFADLATLTISCDGFPQRLPGPKQCGLCTSCLLRRQGLRVAGIPDDRRDDFGYQWDIYRRYGTLSADKKLGAQALLDQARRFRSAAVGGWNGVVREFPSLLELPDSIDAQGHERLVEMYARYGAECEPFGDAILRGARRFA